MIVVRKLEAGPPITWKVNDSGEQAWLENDVPQCGYCQAGQIMATVDFLKKFPSPTDDDIDTNMTNLCRCGTYARIRKAIHRAAELTAAGAEK